MPIFENLEKSSYYDKNNRQAAALMRARRPYLIKNIVTGLSLFSLTVGIYIYTIKAISQDNFEDVKVPDAPIQTSQANTSTIREALPAKK